MMTDNDIIKALECCKEAVSTRNCDDCPLQLQECIEGLPRLALDLINRQRTEIESRRAEVKELKFRLDQNNDERSRNGIMFEETLKENEDLKKKVDFLSGQCEAYKYCISKIGGE